MLRIKKVLILILVLVLSISTVQTYAYLGSLSHTAGNLQIAIGEWQVYQTWDQTSTYTIGDIVFYDGQYWIRTSSSGTNHAPSLRPPGRNFWAVYSN